MTDLVVPTLLALAALLITWQLHRQRWLQRTLRRRVLVQTTAGQTIDGLLVRHDTTGLEIGPATVDGEALAGTVWLPRDQVAWVQDPEGTDR